MPATKLLPPQGLRLVDRQHELTSPREECGAAAPQKDKRRPPCRCSGSPDNRGALNGIRTPEIGQGSSGHSTQTS